jgi:hypothetical protein
VWGLLGDRYSKFSDQLDRYADHIPAIENGILGRSGYFCHNAAATTLIEDYGFLPALTCGSAS